MAKFNVGQGVFLIICVEDKYQLYDGMLVIRRISNDKLGIHYSLENKYEDILDWCIEEDVFSNLKEARAEVDKRNGKVG